jgi:hypothetical protein
MFEDDKEFFQDTFSFLNSKTIGEEKGEGSGAASLLGGEADLTLKGEESPKFMLNIGSGTIVPVEQKSAEAGMKVLIHEAKEFLKKELVKHSINEKEMPNTLRGLVSLASTKGISVKDIKFSPETVQKVSTGDVQFEFGKGIPEPTKTVQSLGTDSFLQSRQNFANKNSKESAIASANSQIGKPVAKKDAPTIEKFSLNSLLNSDEVVKGESPKTEIVQPSGQIKETPKNLSGLLQSDSFVELKEKNSLLSKEASKSGAESAMVKNISQKMNISPELLLQIFSEDELAELDGGSPTNTKLNLGETSIETSSKTVADDLSVSSDTKVRSEFEQKVTTARTMMRTLVSDLKEMMENYRPPVTKLSLSLNPNNMGEVDVTLIQRGQNMHINLSGNQTAVNLLQNNSAELRNQLNDAGLSNHSFNFNGGNGGNENSRREEERVRELQKELLASDSEEEFVDSLDMVISRVA